MASLLKKNKRALLLVLGTWGLLFFFLWPFLFFENAGGIYSGLSNIWADWAAHMTFSSVFAYKDPVDWFTHHPLFIGDKFNYPFMTNLISGMILRMGFSASAAFLLPSYLTTVLFFSALTLFFQRVFNSVAKTFVAVSIFLLSGGLGFVIFLQDLRRHPFWETLLYPPRTYTHLPDQNIHAINWISSEFLPQRAFFLGLPIALFVWMTLERWVDQKFKKVSTVKLLALACLAALLTLIHSHSVIALAIMCACLFALRPEPLKPWLIFGSACFLMGAAMYVLFLKPHTARGFFVLQLGWMAEPTWLGFLKFWWQNWGVFLPLAMLGAWRLKCYRHPLFISGMVLFIFSNLFRVSPWNWDNTKILTWSYLCLTIPVVNYLAELWKNPQLANRLSVAVTFLLIIFSGTLDVYRVIRTDRDTSAMWSREDIVLAQKFRDVSAPTDVVLVSPRDIHHWAARLTGRQVVLGYLGTVWSYGFDYSQLEKDVTSMLRGDGRAESLFQKYNVQFVTIGNSEIQDYGANEMYFRDHFEKILENSHCRVYRMRAKT
jgi:hypothetical protein